MRCFFQSSIVALALVVSPVLHAGSDQKAHQSPKKYDKHDVLKDDHLDDHDHHEEEEAEMLKKRLAEMKGADIYSCHLQDFSHQCREYPIPEDVKSKLPDLKQSCESMPQGRFNSRKCPPDNLVGKCIHIQRNYHDPKTLIYDNHYYGGDGSPWTRDEMARVCEDLEGELVLE
ncbi:MAG: hypothetical protein R3208_10745 [Ketobacteraceae bacterium]|nr:hypothetical protein [Ketobacteraceae bacterium]